MKDTAAKLIMFLFLNLADSIIVSKINIFLKQVSVAMDHLVLEKMNALQFSLPCLPDGLCHKKNS
ncbi:hypothetical protein D3C86_2074760 [compost metagenome]